MTKPRSAQTPRTAPPPPDYPDLSGYLQVHQAFRVSHDRLVTCLEHVRPDNEAQLQAIRRWFAGLSGELRAHHRHEDHVFFPALAHRVPSYADYAATLAHDHDRLDPLIDGLQAALARIATTATARNTAQPEAVSIAVELRDLLAAHLDFEDTDILPMFERHFGAAEYTALEQQAIKSVEIRQALFTVPWLVSTSEPDVAEKMLREAPMPLRIVHLLSRRRYARLERAAFGRATSSVNGGRS